MKVGKPKSKRVPVRLRHKIQKASAAKQRKQKKLAKQNPEWRSKLKKDPGIPNLFPYKEKLIHEIEENKRRKEEDAKRRKQEAQARRDGERIDETGDQVMNDDAGNEELLDYAEYSDDESGEDDAMVDDGHNPMAALLASARARAHDFDNEGDGGDDSDFSGFGSENEQAIRRESSRHAYDKTFREVLSNSDVILYILDARDPEGTRSRAIEREITASPDKRLLFLLNKIDLIPPETLRNWLIHLRQSFPTLPLRTTSPSSTSSQTFDHATLTAQNTATALLKALKSWAAGRDISKRAVSVGVLGYPNVGKSSVINAILSLHSGASAGSKRAVACPVGATAGVTTAMRTVKLDSRLTLLDSPGIVFPSAESSDGKPRKPNSAEEQARLILLNAIPPKEIEDPQPAISLLLKRLSTIPGRQDALLAHYGIPALMSSSGSSKSDKTTDFLVQVARKRGRLGKGGVPNLYAAAMVVITDWREGRIQGWVEAPKSTAPVGLVTKNGSNESSETAAQGKLIDQKVVSGWAEEFKLDGLWGDSEP